MCQTNHATLPIHSRAGVTALAAAAVLTLAMPFIVLADPVADCGKPAFQQAVAEASAALNDLNRRNGQLLQEKMQRLKASKGWSDNDLAANAKALISDETTAAMDAQGKALVAKAGTLNAEGASAEKLCALLQDVRALMGEIVGNARSRWDYMLAKIDTALGVNTAAKNGQ